MRAFYFPKQVPNSRPRERPDHSVPDRSKDGVGRAFAPGLVVRMGAETMPITLGFLAPGGPTAPTLGVRGSSDKGFSDRGAVRVGEAWGASGVRARTCRGLR